MYSRHYRVPLFYDLTPFQISREKLSNFFVGILVETMTPKGHFEINWPLVILQIIGLQSRIIKVFLDPKTNNLLMRVRKILESKYHFSYILLSFSIKHKSTPVSIIIIKMDQVPFFFKKLQVSYISRQHSYQSSCTEFIIILIYI